MSEDVSPGEATQPDLPGQIAEIAKRLQEAQDDFEEAISEEHDARMHTVACKNALNMVQKEFDAAVAALRSRAAEQTEWANQGQDRNVRHPGPSDPLEIRA